MPKFTKHLFVCGNQRPEGHPRGSCDLAGTGDLHRAFKAAIAKASASCTVRANKSGCLDQCEHGPVVVVYPEAVWYGNVQLSDVDQVVREHILGGQPVERLRLPDECLNNPACGHRNSNGKS